jgi:putative tricarboxylic transport membrane protein
MLRRADFWSGIFWLGIGAFVTWQGHKLGLGRLNNPGSGFALFWLGLIMSGFAAAILFGSMARGGPSLSDLWAGTRWPRVLTVVALLIAYGLAFETLGFVLSTFALLLALMLFVDPVRWPLAVVIAVAAPVGIWALVTKWLKIQMPAGILAPWIG